MDKNRLKKFKYKAIDLSNKKSSGIMLAHSKDELNKILQDSDLYLVSCKVVPETATTFFSVSGKVKTSEITTFSREFAIMISSGMTIENALELSKNQPYSQLFRRTLDTVHNDVRSGLLLSEAFSKHKKIFSEMFISMICVAESSGSLDSALLELAAYYERSYKIERKAKNSLVYPAILGTMTLAVIILLVVAVIPTFKSTLQKLEVEMPPITQAIISISDFIVANYLIILLCALILILTVYLLFRLEKVNYLWDAIKAKTPIVKNVTSALLSATFARGFGALVSGGVDIVKSLEIMGNLMKNRYYKHKYLAACNDIKKGHSIADAFSCHKVFPKLLTQMIATGEKTGSLDTVLARSTKYFDEQVESSLVKMTTLIEPFIICIMGVIVAIVIIAVFSPLLSIMTTIGG